MLIYLSMIESEADKSLFEQLYIRYKGLMYHIAYRILQNREDAEDAAREFIRQNGYVYGNDGSVIIVTDEDGEEGE